MAGGTTGAGGGDGMRDASVDLADLQPPRGYAIAHDLPSGYVTCLAGLFCEPSARAHGVNPPTPSTLASRPSLSYPRSMSSAIITLVVGILAGTTPLQVPTPPPPTPVPMSAFTKVTVVENTDVGSWKIGPPCREFHVRTLKVQVETVQGPAPDPNWPPKEKEPPPGATKLNPAALGDWKASILVRKDRNSPSHELSVFSHGRQEASTDLGELGATGPIMSQDQFARVTTEPKVGGRVVFAFYVSGVCFKQGDWFL